MDTLTAQKLLKWIVLGVAINATTLLLIVGVLGYSLLQLKRDTREMSPALSGVAAMTRDVAAMTREVLRRIS